jgi:hypothetical protein
VGAVQSPPLPAKWFGHDREEVARILIQSLTDLGYHQSARSLSKESGFELEGPEVAAFRHAVLHGEWAEAEALLFGNTDSTEDAVSHGSGKAAEWIIRGLTLAGGANKNEMLFWLRQQKYLELLEKKDLGSALQVLRQELTPLGHQDTNQLHHLSRLVFPYGTTFCTDANTRTVSSWPDLKISSNKRTGTVQKANLDTTCFPSSRNQ